MKMIVLMEIEINGLLHKDSIHRKIEDGLNDKNISIEKIDTSLVAYPNEFESIANRDLFKKDL